MKNKEDGGMERWMEAGLSLLETMEGSSLDWVEGYIADLVLGLRSTESREI